LKSGNNEGGAAKGEGRETKRINSVRDLEVYKIAFDIAMETTP
jgi:hypothetical protein